MKLINANYFEQNIINNMAIKNRKHNRTRSMLGLECNLHLNHINYLIVFVYIIAASYELGLVQSSSVSRTPITSSFAKERSLRHKLFVPNRLASYVNYNRQNLFHNHYTPDIDRINNNRPRWISLIRGGSDSRRPPSNSDSTNYNAITVHSTLPARLTVPSVISLLVNNISNRLGFRTDVRVSNVLRDLAWQILARLSIPTPVIYELKRMNIYSSSDTQDEMNLAPGSNKSITIRSKKMLNRTKRSTSADRIRSTAGSVVEWDEDEEENSWYLT